MVATFAFAPDAGMVEETMELLGQGFRIWVDFGRGKVTVHEGTNLVLEWQAPEGMGENEVSGSYDETAAFIRALSSGTDMAPTLEDALLTMQTTLAVEENRAMEFPCDG